MIAVFICITLIDVTPQLLMPEWFYLHMGRDRLDCLISVCHNQTG